MTAAAEPLSRWRPGPARLARLLLGLFLFGVGEGLLVAADLGVSPWTVLAQGVARHAPMSVGITTVVISVLLLLIWVPLRQRPGLGTVLNALLIGLFIDLTLWAVPDELPLVVRALLVPTAILLVAVGSGFYLTTRLGPGPRDGLMTGLHRVTGLSLRLVRAGIEVSAVVVGFALGGTVGVGTVAFALLVGPTVQACVHAIGGRDSTSL
jgi:uncharacterized protein